MIRHIDPKNCNSTASKAWPRYKARGCESWQLCLRIIKREIADYNKTGGYGDFSWDFLVAVTWSSYTD